MSTFFKFHKVVNLYKFCVCLQFDVFGLSLACAIIPVIYLCLLVFLPESPMFHLIKGNVKKAVSSLNFFYGSHGQGDNELYIMQKSLTKVPTNIKQYHYD